jgi:hypothetical protein
MHFPVKIDEYFVDIFYYLERREERKKGKKVRERKSVSRNA